MNGGLELGELAAMGAPSLMIFHPLLKAKNIAGRGFCFDTDCN